MFTNQVRQANHLIRQAKCKYCTDKAHSCGANQGELYQVVASLSLTNSDKKLVLQSAIPSTELPDTFADYFTYKIAKICVILLAKLC